MQQRRPARAAAASAAAASASAFAAAGDGDPDADAAAASLSSIERGGQLENGGRVHASLPTDTTSRRARRRRRRDDPRRRRSSFLRAPVPSRRRGRAGSGGIDADAAVRLLLVGFVLVLLCTMAAVRLQLRPGARYPGPGLAPDDDDGVDDGVHDDGPPSAGGRNPLGVRRRHGEREETEGGGGLVGRMKRGAAGIVDGLKDVGKRRKPCPESMGGIGDKSDAYHRLRQEIDAVLPIDQERTRRAVRDLRKREYLTKRPEDMGYSVTNCPMYPPAGYPHAWPTLELLEHWPPDDTTPRSHIHQGICVFDYETELEKARNYRAAEVPFVVRDDPAVLRAAERWNYPEYMGRLLGDVKHRTEYSPDNHFMYWMAPNPNPKKGKKVEQPGITGSKRRMPTPPEGWKPPTQMLRMDWKEWLGHANVTEDNLGPDKPHWYYRLIGCGKMGDGHCDKGSSEYIFDELPFFQPRHGGLYIVEPQRQKGIHCRFGMQGVIAENHFDGSRNSIAVMGGERRYVLSHPEQCSSLALYPKDHPSSRHSAVNWGAPDLDLYPEFTNAESNEIVLQAGDVLYL